MTEKQDLFQRPASYWLRRAKRQWQSGSPLRAAVLERHAVRAEPDSDAACMSYAFTLRRLGCYEASNREAFAALARRPERTSLFGLIGQNMLDLGLRQEGYDAMDIYMADPPAIPPEWQDAAYDRLDEMESRETRPHGPRRYARFEGLLRVAVRHMEAGDLLTARTALLRSRMRPFGGRDAGRELAEALYLQRAGHAEESEALLRQAVARSPRDARILASAAGVYWELGRKVQARAALCQAALAVRTPEERQLVCCLSDVVKAPQIACAMLTRLLRANATRFPLCYDLCVCLTRLGRAQEALPLAHRCLEVDPDDWQGQWLFAHVTALCRGETPKEQPSYYGMPGQAMLRSLISPLFDSLAAGTLAEELTRECGTRERLQDLLSLPTDAGVWLLAAVGPSLPRDLLCRLLRETLLRQNAQTPGKQYAVTLLGELGEPPPYAVWQGNRIAWADPSQPPPDSPTVRQRVLAMRARQTRRLCPWDGGVELWVLRLAGRMTPPQLRSLMRDPFRVWPAALALAYSARMGRPAPALRSDLDALRVRALQGAVRLIQHLDCQGGSSHEAD